MKVKVIETKQYLNEITPYLKDIINNLKKSDTWKIQLTIAINFISSKDNDEEHVMNSKSDRVKGSEFVFDYFHLLYYKCH